MPKISVIVPIYNTEKYLSQCIESILTQTFSDFELILINDGSTDNSGKICDKYASDDSRVVVIHKENGGQSSARNEGLEIARGEYITFVDSDDYYSDIKTLEYCIEILDNDKSISFVEFPIYHPERNYKKNDIQLTKKKDIYIAWLENKVVKTYFCDKVIRREIIINQRFPIGMMFEDRYLFPELINNCKKISVISKGGYYYRQHPNQNSRRTSDPYYLIGMVKSDINILKYIPVQLKKLYAILYYRILSNKIILKENGVKIILPPMTLSFNDLWFGKVPIGIKLRLSLFKCFGLKIYCKIFATN